MSNTSALALTGLGVDFGGLRAVHDVDLSVAVRERRGVIGPNGAGKTTLFNLISGWVKPTGGEVKLLGEDVTGLSPEKLSQKGLTRTFQRTQLCASLSVADNVELSVQAQQKRFNGMWKSVSKLTSIRSEAHEVLEQLGLAQYAAAPAGMLSYGVQRQIEVAMAAATKPSVLLLDEPTSGLSPAETNEVAAFLGRLPEEMTLLIVEHDMDVLFGIADRVLVMDQGEVLADGTPQEIRDDEAVRQAYMGGGDESG